MKTMLRILLFIAANAAFAQKEIPLYSGEIPNSQKPKVPMDTTLEKIPVTGGTIDILHGVIRPTLTVFLPAKEKATGVAVIICPGGGYEVLAMSHEGYDMARRLNEDGIAAFVLKYRLPKGGIMKDKTIGPLQDAQRAIQLVRENAAAWNVDPKKVGILGSSAGGHLASTAGTHWQTATIDNPGNTSLRPDFMILNYAVISFADSLTHNGSRVSLLSKREYTEEDYRSGKVPANWRLLNLPESEIRNYSNEWQVNPQTPPAFITAPMDDNVVPVGNSLYFAAALQQHRVPVETFLYPTGDHGYGMINPKAREQWMEPCLRWIKRNIDPPRMDWPYLKRFENANKNILMKKSNENRVVFMGNSITEGWSNIDPAFFEGKPYINRGISGQTTPQMVLRFRQDVIDLKPAVVVILAGTNDIAGNTGPMTLDQIMNNIISMAEMAKANGIKVVLSSVLPVYDYPWKPGLQPAEKIVSLNKMIQDYAAKSGAVYLDYFSAMVDERKGLRKNLGDDGVHPNLAGYRIMGPLAEGAIAKAVAR